MTDDDMTQLVEEHGARKVAVALELLQVYRAIRIMMLMDESGHRDWDGIAYDELQAVVHETTDSLGLDPEAPLSQAVMREWLTRRIDRLRRMSYRDYLATVEWQDVRYFALQKAGGRCQTCNARARLHVHHRTYARRGHERLADVTVLCATCHKAFHDNRRLSK